MPQERAGLVIMTCVNTLSDALGSECTQLSSMGFIPIRHQLISSVNIIIFCFDLNNETMKHNKGDFTLGFWGAYDIDNEGAGEYNMIEQEDWPKQAPGWIRMGKTPKTTLHAPLFLSLVSTRARSLARSLGHAHTCTQ